MLKILLLTLIAMSNCNASMNNCYKEVINDFSLHSSFLVTKVEHNNEIFTIVIENSNFYYYLNLEYDYKKEDYIQFMINNNKPIPVKNKEIIDYKLEKNKEVKEKALKGKKSFLKHYFDGNVIKNKFVLKDLKPIIFELYTNWCIITYIDDETGYLVYFEKDS